MNVLFIIFIVLTVIVAILMIAIVLVQKSKGGGLSSTFGGGNQVLGVRGTNKFLEQATWTLAALILVLSICSAYTIPKSSVRISKPNYNNGMTDQQAPVTNDTQAPEVPVQ